MAYGDGNITEVKAGNGANFSPRKWRIRIFAGADPITGHKRWISRTVRGTKADARKARDRIRRELDDGLKVDSDRTTFADFAGEWLKAREASGEYAEQTMAKLRSRIPILCKAAGKAKLRDVDAVAVERILSSIRTERGVSSTTLRDYYIIVNQVMKAAMAHDLIARNPCDRLRAPRVAPVDRNSLSASDAARLLSTLETCEGAEREAIEARRIKRSSRKGDASQASVSGLGDLGRMQAVRLGVATGARLGEICALCWDAVNLATGAVAITRSITNEGSFKQPKSRAGVRTVTLDRETLDSMRKWKAYQRQQLARMRIAQNGGTPVCCADTGAYLGIANFERWFRRWRDANGFPGLRFHELRHTQATQLLAAGVDVKTVQTRLGHSTASLTLDLYAHAVPEKDRECADLLGELFAADTPMGRASGQGFRVIKTA